MATKNKKHEYITQAEFARRVGVNRKQVTLAVQSGRIQVSNVTNNRGNFLIDWEEQKDNWDANRRDQTRFSRPRVTEVAEKIHDISDVADEVSSRTPKDPKHFSIEEKIKGEPGSYQYEATRKTMYDAERNRLKFLQEIQQLLPFDEAVALFYEILISLRDNIMAMAARNAGTLTARVKRLVKEWNDGGEDEIEHVISNAFTDAGKLILAEIGREQKKDFKEIKRTRDDAKRKKRK